MRSRWGLTWQTLPHSIGVCWHLSGHQHCRGQGGHHFPSKTSAHPSVHQLLDQDQPSRTPAGRGRLAVKGGLRAGHLRDFPRVLQPAVPGPENDRSSSGGHSRCVSPCPDAQGRKKVSAFCGQQASLPFHLSTLRIGNFSSGVHQAFTPGRSVKPTRCEAAHLLRDVWRIRADTPEQAQLHVQTTISVHQFLGWIINYEKSDFTPSQNFHFIGRQFNTQQFTVAPLPKMRLKIQCVHQHWMTNPSITVPDPHRLLGVVVFLASLVPRGRLPLLPVQWWAATAGCQRTGSWTDRTTAPQWVLSEVAWWASQAVLQGLPLAARNTEVTLFTDASSSGWGAQLGSRSTQEQWSASQRSWHFNVLEMQAVINAVRDFLPHLRSRVVRLMGDNIVNVAYIKNKGGTRSYTLMQMTIRLLKWCDRKAITLVPLHLPGVHNIQADSLSRVSQTLNTEGTMAMEHLRPVFASGASRRSTCLRLSPTDNSTTLHLRIWTPGLSSWMPCRCPGTTGRASCLHSRHSSWSLKYCRRSLSLQGSRWLWALHCRRQLHGSRVVGSVPRRSHPAVRLGSIAADSRHRADRRGDRDSSLPAVKSTRVETLRANLMAKGHSRGSCSHDVKGLRDSSLQVYDSHWARFVSFCRSKRWHVFRVRSHHFSTYMMHLFRDGLLPSTIISHRTSVASVLRLWVYDPAAYRHFKLLFRAFRLECLVQRRIMPKWDLHLVLLALLRPPFASECDIQGETSDDVIPLKWRTMKTVFLLALASARWRSYIHALSVSPGRCVFLRGNTERQLVVSLCPETGFLVKNRLPSQALEWISLPGIAHLNPSEAERMLSPVRQLRLGTERVGGVGQWLFIHWNRNIWDNHAKSYQLMECGDCQRLSFSPTSIAYTICMQPLLRRS